MEIYDNVKEMETFNGFHVFAIDGSYVEIPNHPQAREEMGVPQNNDVETFAANARISCTVDTKMDFVVSSIIDSQTVDEITLALRHLEDLKNKINMNKVKLNPCLSSLKKSSIFPLIGLKFYNCLIFLINIFLNSQKIFFLSLFSLFS